MNSHRNKYLELYRKIFHIVSISLWIPLIYFLPHYILLPLFCIVIFINFALTQKYNWLILRPLYILTKYIERKKNENRPGIQGLWANIGILLTYLIFDKEITILAVLILAVGDGLSGIVGFYLGRCKLPLTKGKTVEGTLAFLFSAFILTYSFFDFKTALAVSITSTIVELFFDIPDDNMTVPLSVGFSCTVVQLI